jgi:sarcosine oxidase subunit beta
MSDKIIVCRCEDVTQADLLQALEEGYLDIEEVKRYTGLGTGPCQGKECLVPTCEILAAAQAQDPQRRARQPEAPPGLHPFTTRPPVYPVSLGVLATARKRAP